MRKSLIALAGAASIGVASLAAPSPANAWCVGCAVGAGILGGVAAGAIVGSAIANSPYYYPPPGYYYPPPPGYYYPPPPGAYYPPPPGAEYPPPPGAAAAPGPAPAYAQLAPGCHWAKRKVWVEDVGYRTRTVQVCP
jgi:hypothetical protein